MTDDQKKDLQLMRAAAKRREWTTLQDTLKRLFATLDPLLALQIGATRVHPFLPTFESYYPDAGWVREVLLTVISYASAPADLPEHTINQFPSPGCGNFVMAVLDCARVVQDKYSVFERYSHATNVVANGILAELTHVYFADRLDVYAQFIDPATDQATRNQIQYDFWLDKDVEQIDQKLWLQIAYEIKKRIEGK
jgi:hypothetical protein